MLWVLFREGYGQWIMCNSWVSFTSEYWNDIALDIIRLLVIFLVSFFQYIYIQILSCHDFYLKLIQHSISYTSIKNKIKDRCVSLKISLIQKNLATDFYFDEIGYWTYWLNSVKVFKGST